MSNDVRTNEPTLNEDEEMCVFLQEGAYSEADLIGVICNLRTAQNIWRSKQHNYLPMPRMPQ